VATTTAGCLFGTSEPGSRDAAPTPGLPPLLDLTQSKPHDSGIDRAWESRFKGLGFSRGITDLGVPGPSEATSIATTFIDTVGRPSALPARSCPVVVIAKAVDGESRIDCSRTFVYSRYSLEISKGLRENRRTVFRKASKLSLWHSEAGFAFRQGI
jgi:hypothetical protein